MGRHAYCIIAHTDVYCLVSLLKLIDDRRNDIYLLIDSKSKLLKELTYTEEKRYDQKKLVTPLSDLKSSDNKTNITSASPLYLINKRIDIRWGDISQVEAELALFEAVSESDIKYDYIHLISGVDLPIKNQDQIHNYFDSLKKGTNMIGFSNGESNSADLKEKTQYYHLFTGYQRNGTMIIRKICALIRKLWIGIQKKTNTNRVWNDFPNLYKGANWASITGDFCNYLSSHKKDIVNRFRGAKCPDEIYKQTIIKNSSFANTIYDMALDNAAGTREIDWTRDKPYTWTISDYDYLMNAKGLFARKFSSFKDKGIIDRIYNSIKA